jgi:hypothetical protein
MPVREIDKYMLTVRWPSSVFYHHITKNTAGRHPSQLGSPGEKKRNKAIEILVHDRLGLAQALPSLPDKVHEDENRWPEPMSAVKGVNERERGMLDMRFTLES